MNEEHFDQLIRDALRAQPEAEQVARLEAFWKAHSRRERRTRTVRRVLALAASLLAAAAIAGWIVRQKFSGIEVVEAPRPNRAGTLELKPSDLDPPQVAIAETPLPSVGREPTAMEQFAFYSHAQWGRAAENQTLVTVVDDLVQQVEAGEADPRQAVEAAGIAMTGIERELLRRLVRSTDEEKRTLLRFLAVSGSENSTLALLKLTRRDTLRNESLLTIEQIVGVAGLADVARLSNDARVRGMLMQRLLTAEANETNEGVGAYLSLVQDAALRGEALAAADAVSKLPVQALMARLQSDADAVRLSAALVLGHVNGPEVTRSLVELVSAERPAPTEAWIALLACRGELAEEFLSYATRRPQLLGQVNHARVQWTRIKL